MERIKNLDTWGIIEKEIEKEKVFFEQPTVCPECRSTGEVDYRHPGCHEIDLEFTVPNGYRIEATRQFAGGWKILLSGSIREVSPYALNIEDDFDDQDMIHFVLASEGNPHGMHPSYRIVRKGEQLMDVIRGDGQCYDGEFADAKTIGELRELGGGSVQRAVEKIVSRELSRERENEE
jgi:hypothetical protein